MLDIPLPSRERRAPAVSSAIILSLSLGLHDVVLLIADSSGCTQGSCHAVEVAHVSSLSLGEGHSLSAGGVQRMRRLLVYADSVGSSLGGADGVGRTVYHAVVELASLCGRPVAASAGRTQRRESVVLGYSSGVFATDSSAAFRASGIVLPRFSALRRIPWHALELK